MQPSWRKEGELLRDVPRDESWQTLRKGGTAGIYVVVMGLSWWVKAQHIEHDINAWALVDDLSWVIQQLKLETGSALSVPQKRARDDANGEASQRKT